MKKLIALLMSSALLLSLAACSGDKTDTDVNTETTAAAVNDETVATEETTAAEENNDTEAKTPSRGTIDENTYINEFIGITFEKPEDWSFMTDEELAETLNIGQEMMDLNSLEKLLSEQASVYDMAAKDATGMNSVMVVYENTMLTALKQFTAEEYIDLVTAQLTSVDGIEYNIGETEDVTLGNTQFKKVTAAATVEGIELTQAYYVCECGKYIASFVITSSTVPVEEIEAMFS